MLAMLMLERVEDLVGMLGAFIDLHEVPTTDRKIWDVWVGMGEGDRYFVAIHCRSRSASDKFEFFWHVACGKENMCGAVVSGWPSLCRVWCNFVCCRVDGGEAPLQEARKGRGNSSTAEVVHCVEKNDDISGGSARASSDGTWCLAHEGWFVCMSRRDCIAG